MQSLILTKTYLLQEAVDQDGDGTRQIDGTEAATAPPDASGEVPPCSERMRRPPAQLTSDTVDNPSEWSLHPGVHFF